MTREQQVALDAMRSAWPEEVVQRMLRAQSGRIETALARHRRYMMGDYHRERHRTREEDGREWQEIYAELLSVGALVPPFSPPEKPQGVHAPQPQAPQEETEEPRHVVRPEPFRHVCTEPAQDCFCQNFPGAGAG